MRTKYRVIGPDQLPIFPTDFDTFEDADSAIGEYAAKYEVQGHYRRADGLKIHVGVIPRYCTIEEHRTR